jgi:hypothetical protein
MIKSDPQSRRGRRIRGKLRKLLESEDPAERATAERVLAQPAKRGRQIRLSGFSQVRLVAGRTSHSPLLPPVSSLPAPGPTRKALSRTCR